MNHTSSNVRTWFLSLWRRRPGFALLFFANIFVFVLLLILGVDFSSPTASDLLAYGGVRRYEYLQGEYWRFLTAMFIHAGIAHLVMNMLALHITTLYLGVKIGPFLMVLIYLIGGIGAGLASVVWYDNAVGVGASGAISGFFGVLLVFAFCHVYPAAVTKSLKELLLSIIGLTAFLGVTGLLGNLDNAAHLGGLISGILMGFVLLLLFADRLRS